MDKYIKIQGYPLGTLVAFSGEVHDLESGAEPFTETSAGLNPNLKRPRPSPTPSRWPIFICLLVANKFQNGCSTSRCCAACMSIAVLQASRRCRPCPRLNRAHPGKDTTYILDFVNSAEEVLAAFKIYFETAELEAVTDPDLIFDLRAKLDAAGHYDSYEVDRVAVVLMTPKSTQGDLIAANEPVADRLLKRYAGGEGSVG